MATAVFTWKVVHLGRPGILLERMQVTPDCKIQTQQPRLQLTKDCYRWRAGDQWNSLPQDLRQELAIARLKNQVKELVLQERTWDPGD